MLRGTCQGAAGSTLFLVMGPCEDVGRRSLFRATVAACLMPLSLPLISLVVFCVLKRRFKKKKINADCFLHFSLPKLQSDPSRQLWVFSDDAMLHECNSE